MKPGWTRRSSRLTLWLGISAILVAILGLMLARYDLIPKIAGLYAMIGGALIAFAGVLAGLIAGVLNVKHKAQHWVASLIGLVLSGGYAGFMVSRADAARAVPAIHDITTNLANPPRFHRLTLRPDNLAGVETLQNWRAIHAKAYGDLKPLVLARPAAQVLADAERLARQFGWAVATIDPNAGQMEATASVSFIRYKDDIVLRVVPTPDGRGSVVDMRSVSRIGVSDFGVNAKRIRAFLTTLRKS
jgi:uncharacterized protein (DUF1499 family)